MPPTNNNFANAFSFGVDHHIYDVDMTGATLETGEPIGSAAAGITGSAWWKVDLSTGSYPVPVVISVDTYYPAYTLSGDQYDQIGTTVTAFQGTTLAGLTEITSNDGFNPGGNNAGSSSEWWPNNQQQGHVIFLATAPNVYYIQVGAFTGGRIRVECRGVPERPAVDGKVLFFAPSLNPFVVGHPEHAVHSYEHRFIRGILGFQTEIVDAAGWNAKTTADFSAYRAIIIGARNDDGAATLRTSANTWGPAIAGNMVLAQTNPEFAYELHYRFGYRSSTGNAVYDYPGKKMIENLASYAVSSDKGCGLFMLGRIANVALLAGLPGGGGIAGFNGFTVSNEGFDNPHITVPEHPAFTTPNILADGVIAGFLYSINSTFHAFPRGLGYQAVACDLDTASSGYTNEDGTLGWPYIIIRDAPCLLVDLPTDAQPIRFCESFMLSDTVTKRWQRFPGAEHYPRVVPTTVGKAMFVTKQNLFHGEISGAYVQVPESWKKVVEFTYRYSNQSGGTGAFHHMNIVEIGRDPTTGMDSGWGFGYLYQFADGHLSFDNRAELDGHSSGSLRLLPDTDYRIQIKAKWYLEAGQSPPYPGSIEVRVNGATWISEPNAQLNVGNWSSQGLTKVAFGQFEDGHVYADVWFSNIVIRDDIGTDAYWDFLPTTVKVIGLRPEPWIVQGLLTGGLVCPQDWRYAEYQAYTQTNTAAWAEETPDDDLSYQQVAAGHNISSNNLAFLQGLDRGSTVYAVAFLSYMRAENGTTASVDMKSYSSPTSYTIRTVSVGDKYRYYVAMAALNPATGSPWVLGNSHQTLPFFSGSGTSINTLVPDLAFAQAGRISVLGCEVVLDHQPATPPGVGSASLELVRPIQPVLVDSFAHEQEDQLGGSETPSSDYRILSWEGGAGDDTGDGFSDHYIRPKSWKWSARYGDVSFTPADTSGNGAEAKIVGYRSSLDQFLIEFPTSGLYGPSQIGFGFYTDAASQWASKGVVDPQALIRLLTTYQLRDSTQWPGAMRITVSLRKDGYLVLNADRGAQSIFHGLNAVSTIPLPNIATRQVIEVRWLTGYNNNAASWGATYSFPFIELRINGLFAGRWEVNGNDRTNQDHGILLDPHGIYGGSTTRYEDASDYIRLGGDWLNPGDPHNLTLHFSDFYSITMDINPYMDWQNDYHGNQYLGSGLRVVPQIPSADVTPGDYTRIGSSSDSGAIGVARDTLTSDRHNSTIRGGTNGTHSVYTFQPANIPDDGRIYFGTFATTVSWPIPGTGASPPRPERKGATSSVYNQMLWYNWSGEINIYQQIVGGGNDQGFFIYGDGAYMSPDYFLTAATWNSSTKGLRSAGTSTRMSQLVFESLIGSPAVTVVAPRLTYFQFVG